MSNLVKRLRNWQKVYPDDEMKEEDRIEELESKVSELAILALEECPFRDGTGSYEDWWYERQVAVAKLRG